MVAVGKKRNGMINKTIICLSARANSGKTTSIRELFFRLTGHYPESTGDFLSIVQDKNVEHGIGISSVGDSWGNREPIEKLIDAGCEIIVCASRTSKDTLRTAQTLAKEGGYKFIRIHAAHIETENRTFYEHFYHKNAEAIENVIKSIIQEHLNIIEL